MEREHSAVGQELELVQSAVGQVMELVQSAVGQVLELEESAVGHVLARTTPPRHRCPCYAEFLFQPSYSEPFG
eukprot:SAG31_NODE_739_length_12444_cov_14.976831_4_plen_73_part_00